MTELKMRKNVMSRRERMKKRNVRGGGEMNGK